LFVSDEDNNNKKVFLWRRHLAIFDDGSVGIPSLDDDSVVAIETRHLAEYK
jgi:hypothetical protein